MNGVAFETNQTAHKRGCVVGIPTLGLVHIDFGLSLKAEVAPLNWEAHICKIEGRPVDEARNAIVEAALAENAEYVYFRDDDVLAGTDALNRLYSLRVPIASGVVWGKVWPTHPMAFTFGKIGSFIDWKPGDCPTVDWTGMGCSLIRTEVFEKIEPPWFKTEPSEIVELPNGEIGTRGHTEDFYFFVKAAKAGYKPILATDVMTAHIDIRAGRRYYWDPNLNHPVCLMPDGSVVVYPPAAARADLQGLVGSPPAEVPEVVRYHLGCGGQRLPGYINADLYSKAADETGDCRRLAWLRQKYGLADEIYASHLLEHFRTEEVPGILRDWVDTLKPGGELHFHVPDVEWSMRRFLDCSKDHPERHNRMMDEIWGGPGSGMGHQTGFTVELLMAALRELPLAPIEIEVHEPGEQIKHDPGFVYRQQDIEVRASKTNKEE